MEMEISPASQPRQRPPIEAGKISARLALRQKWHEFLIAKNAALGVSMIYHIQEWEYIVVYYK
jgi:hypothetical protein